MATQAFIHTRLSRAYLALARLSCFRYTDDVVDENSQMFVDKTKTFTKRLVTKTPLCCIVRSL